MNNSFGEFLLQWNARSVISHWEQFKAYILKHRPLVAAIQETRFLDSDDHNYNFKIRGYSLYTNNINLTPRRGGSALYVSNKLLHHEIDIKTQLNAVAVKVKIGRRDISIVSVYLPPAPAIPFQALAELFTNIPSPCIILGDLNAHHRAWGCTNNDTRGNHIDTLINNHNLVCINDRTPTHASVHGNNITYSIIDLSLVSSNISPCFTSHVQPDPYFSDHNPIHIELEISSGQTDYNFLPRWNTRKANWHSYSDNIDETYPCNSSPPIEDFLRTINESAQQNIPRTRRARERKNAPWWNAECQRAVALRRRTERAFRRCICTPHEHAARKARYEAKMIIKQAKQESWAQYANQFNRFTPLSKIWTLIKSFTNKRTPMYKVPHLYFQNVHYSLPFEVANAFALHYAEVSASTQYSAETTAFLCNALNACEFESENAEIYNLPFTIYELQLALSKCGNTSVGPDELAYPFFKNLSETGRNNLLSAFNEMWTQCTFPQSWRSSTLIPILKPRKLTSDPASYRPISLTSCACKLVERIVNNRLRVHLENNNLLSPFQQGFRARRSAADSLISLIDSIQRGFQRRSVTVALFLDLKAAFDKVNRSAVLIKMHKMGIRGRLAKFVKNFLSDRSFSVRCGNTYSNPTQQEQGLPQGAVLSPTLFLIMINDVFDNIHDISQQIKFSMYADDLAVWFSDVNVDRANRIIQLALNHIQAWCDRWGLNISPTKSATVIFSRQRKNRNPSIPLNVNGLAIPLVTSFKYLGITLDRRLTFNEHILDLRQRSSRRIGILKCIAGRDWGADRKTLLTLYITLIRSIFDYCAFLYDGISASQNSSLEAVQNTALRIITGALRTSPVDSLLAETNIPRLSHRRKLQLLRYYSRITAQPNHSSSVILHNAPAHRYLTPEQERYPTISVRVRRAVALLDTKLIPLIPLKPLRHFWSERTINVEYLVPTKKYITSTEIVARFNEYVSANAHSVFYYTDGSRKEGRTGAAYTTTNYYMYFRLSDYHSVYSAELFAINTALRRISVQNHPHSTVCTDSLSAACALASAHNDSNPIVSQIRHTFSTLPQNIKVTILWIPGHSGIPGNDQADNFAKQSLALPQQNHLSCTVSDAYNNIYSSFKRFIQRDWELTPHRHLIQIKPTLQHWPSAHQNTRHKEVTLARLRIGHTKTTHSYIFEREPPTMCHRCNVRYNVTHMLLICPIYQHHRQPLIHYTNFHKIPFDLPTLLGDAHPELLKLLFIFLQNTQLDKFI